MPPKNRGHGGSGGPRPHGAASIREGHDEVAQIALTGRVGGTEGRSAPGSHRPPTEDLVTHRTGDRGGVPSGHPTDTSKQDAEVTRSLELENSGAQILADQGYRIQQNPSPAEIAQARQDFGDTGRPTSKPDYLLEGRVFDCYSPTRPTKGVRGIWSEVEEKVVDRQTQRVVVNLEDWRGDMTRLRKQFEDWPIDQLKEVKAITPDGDIIQILPLPDPPEGDVHGA